MKALFLCLSLAVAQVAVAKDLSSSDDDSVTGTADFHMQKAYSVASKTKSQQTSSSSKFVSNLSPPTIAFLNPKPPNVKFPSLPEAIPIPRTQVVAVAHASTYVPHVAVPEVHLLGDDHHLEVFKLSNGLQVVPLDDPYGHISDYIYLGSEIDLVPRSNTFYLPATDIIDGHTSYVNLGTNSGHLSLSEVRIGNAVLKGFEGVDDIGPVFIPVKRRSQRLVVNPVIYRTDRLSFY